MKQLTLFALCAGTLTLSSQSGWGQSVTQSTNYVVNAAIPDNDLNGLSDTRTFNTTLQEIADVNVSLVISGGFNGDLFGYLTHASGFTVLLNREGRAASNPDGYPDSGFNMVLDDEAVNGDLHSYRLTVNPLGGALTGIWQPDGRTTAPQLAFDLSPRDALLNSFDGLNPNGEWTLFVADVSLVGTSILVEWGIEVTAVPEPGTWALFGIGAIASAISYWRTRR